MFADATTISITGRNLKFLFKKINDDLHRLRHWFDSNSLSLNKEKSKFIIFRSKNKTIHYPGEIKIGGAKIEQVENTKFLGVYIDQYLDWKVHVNYILSKLTCGVYSLYKVKNILPQFSKKLLYAANVQSHLLYGISAWGPMLFASDLKKIKVKQNNAVRAVFNLNHRERIQPYYKNSKFLKVEDLIELSLLKISFRYTNNTLPIRIVNMFEFNNHGYQTRLNQVLRTPLHSTTIYNKCFIGRAPHFWHNLPQNIKDIKNIKLFNKKVSQLKSSGY